MNSQKSRLRVTYVFSVTRWAECVCFVLALLSFAPSLLWVGRGFAVVFLALLLWDVVCRTRTSALSLGQRSLSTPRWKIELTQIKRIAMAIDGARFVIISNRVWKGRTTVFVHKSHRAAAKMRITAWADAHGIEITRL